MLKAIMRYLGFAQQNLHGTIYRKQVIGDYTYHCHAYPADNALETESVWQVWREHTVDGDITSPTQNGVPAPGFQHAIDDVENLNYWSTT